MPSLRNMVGETGVIEIPVSNDEPLVVIYKRGKRSPRENIRLLKAQRKLSAATAGGGVDPEMFELMVSMLADMLVSWNLTTDAGLPIPTDAESLMDVDVDVLMAVTDEIGRQGRPDPLSGGGSSNGSSPTESSEPRQIGTPSS